MNFYILKAAIEDIPKDSIYAYWPLATKIFDPWPLAFGPFSVLIPSSGSSLHLSPYIYYVGI
jgi:hypothetical protein